MSGSSLSSGLVPLGGRTAHKIDPADLDMDLLLLDEIDKPLKKSTYSPSIRRNDVKMSDDDDDNDEYEDDEDTFTPTPTVRKPGVSNTGYHTNKMDKKDASPIKTNSKKEPSDSISSSATTVRRVTNTGNDSGSKHITNSQKEDIFAGDDFDDILGDFLAPKKKSPIKSKQVSMSVDSGLSINMKKPLEDDEDNVSSTLQETSNRPRTAPGSLDNANNNINNKDEESDIGIGFTPSFFEAGRQPRSRRGVSRSTDTSLKSSPTPDLDDILGPPARKPVSDPFASVEPLVTRSLSALPASTSSSSKLTSSVSKPTPPLSLSRDSSDDPANDDPPSPIDRHISTLRHSLSYSEPPAITPPPTLSIDTAPAQDIASPDRPPSVSSTRRRSNLSVSFDSEVSPVESASSVLSRNESIKSMPSSSRYTSVQLEAVKESEEVVGNANASANGNVSGMQLTEEMIQRIVQSVRESSNEEKSVLKKDIDEIKALFTSSNTTLLSSSSSAELLEAQKKIQELETEVLRLRTDLDRVKEDASMAELRLNEQAKYLKLQHEQELTARENAARETLHSLSRRQEEAVEALKRVHLEELAAVKDRAKEGEALSVLAAQIKNTSGSMRLIEEQLAQRHGGLDLAKEGQMAARERLLSEMEDKARERAEAAEAETFRLKGLLMHMETVASSLRNQSAEEKERLRQEHQRLLSMQSSLEAERQTMRDRMKEDNAEIIRRRNEANELLRNAEDEKYRVQEELVALRRKLEEDREEFVTFVTRSSVATEAASNKIKEEEKRLHRLREEIYDQRNVLNQQRADASTELMEADKVRKEINSMKNAIESEKEEVERAAQDLRKTSNLLHARDAELQALSKDLSDREKVLREGFEKVSQVGESVLRRESELSFQAQQLSLQQVEMDRLDEALSMKKVSVAASQREKLRVNRSIGFDSNNVENQLQFDNIEENLDGFGVSNARAESRRTSMQESRLETSANYSKKSEAWEKLKNMKSVELDPEIILARKAMSHAKTKLVETAHLRDHTMMFLGDEASFLARLRNR